MNELLTDEEITALLARREDSDVEAKAELNYKSSGEQEAEFVKDILGLVNKHEPGTAYLIVGVRNDGTVCGIEPGKLRDENLQEFLQSRIEPRVRFSFREYRREGKMIGIIAIARSEKRFHVASKEIKNYSDQKMILRRKGDIFVRHGSSVQPIAASDMERLRDKIVEKMRAEIDRPSLSLSFVSKNTEMETGWDYASLQAGYQAREKTFHTGEPYTMPTPSYVEFYLWNVGNAVAEDIIVTITFPSECKLVTLIPVVPLYPELTKPPNSRFFGEDDYVLEVTWEGPFLHDASKGKLLAKVLVDTPVQEKNYPISWKAHCRNMKEPATGNLTLYINSKYVERS